MEERVFRIGILGDEGVGKTALLVRFLCHRFLGEYDPTIEDKYRKTLCVDDVTVTLEILDTASRGHHSSKLRDQFLKDGDGFIVVYSTTNRTSFQNLPQYRNLINESRDLPDSSPVSVTVIGNKSDLTELRTVSKEEGLLVAEKYGWIYAEASALEYEGADSYIVNLVRDIMAKKGIRDGIHRDSVTSLASEQSNASANDSAKYFRRRRNSLISLFSARGAKIRNRLTRRSSIL